MKTISDQQFRKIYGDEVAEQFAMPLPKQPTFLERLKSSASQGISKMGQAISESQAGKNPLSTGAKFGAGAIETVFSPVSAAIEPVIKPTLGRAIDYGANKLADLYGENVARGLAEGGKTAAEYVLETTGDLATMAGTAFGAVKVPKVGGAGTPPGGGMFGDLNKQVMTAARSQVDSAPAKIMQRVARISKGKQAKFESMAGESVGNYLTKRGIFGSIDDIATQLYKRFTQAKDLADNELAKLKGTFNPQPVKTALAELYERELRTSTPGAPSQILGQVQQLVSKPSWTMSEINLIKRLYERNVKTDYLRSNLPENIAKANNIDSAIRNWQMSQAKQLGLKNLDKINKETQLAKQLMDDIGKEYSGAAGNNAVSITDWIMLSGGDVGSIGAFLVKKTFSSKAVQSAIAKALNKGKPIMTGIEAETAPSQVLGLPAPKKGSPQIQIDVPMRMPSRKAIESGTEIVPQPYRTTRNPKTGDIYTKNVKTGEMKITPSKKIPPQ